MKKQGLQIAVPIAEIISSQAIVASLIGWLGNRKHFSGEFLEYMDTVLDIETKRLN